MDGWWAVEEARGAVPFELSLAVLPGTRVTWARVISSTVALTAP